MQQAFVLDYPSSKPYSLTIEGGYSPNFGNDCGTPPATPDARLTVLDRGLWRLHLAVGATSIQLRGLTLQNTFSGDPTHAPIEITADSAATGQIEIENSILFGNSSATTSAIYISAAQGSLLVQNSLFAGNLSLAAMNPIRFRSLRNGAFCTSLVNSTFAGNTSSLPALYVFAPNCATVAANDVFWGSAPGGDVVFENPSFTYLVSDDFADLAETANAQVLDVISVDPQFEADFSLADFSPLRDRGSTGSAFFTPGTFDVGGEPRTYHGELPDIGAFEIQDVILAHDFDVDFTAL